MTNPQNYSAVGIATVKWTPSAHVDVTVQTGVQSKAETPLAQIGRVMQDIRASGKCGMVVIRWDGSAWNIHRCDPPCRVNEA